MRWRWQQICARCGALEYLFIAEIERCVEAAAERPTAYAAIDKMLGY